MRLCGIDTIEAGNAFLPAFMEVSNARFAKAPFNAQNVHRTPADDLDDAFAWKEERTVSMNLTLQYDQVLFMLDPTPITRQANPLYPAIPIFRFKTIGCVTANSICDAV